MKIFSAAVVVACAVIALLISGGVGSSGAEGEASDASVVERLDQIAADQKTIIEKLDAMQIELNTIKIRITQNQ